MHDRNTICVSEHDVCNDQIKLKARGQIERLLRRARVKNLQALVSLKDSRTRTVGFCTRSSVANQWGVDYRQPTVSQFTV